MFIRPIEAPNKVIKPIVKPPIFKYVDISSSSESKDSFLSISKEFSEPILSPLKILKRF